MNENQEHLEAIELSMEAAQEKIKIHKMFMRLKKNVDYVDLIEERYMKKYALRLVELRAKADPKALEYIDGQLNAISYLNQFFMYVTQEGRQAEAALEMDREEHSRLMEEEEL